MTFLTLAKKVRQECGLQGTGPTTVVGQSNIIGRVVDWTADADVYIQSLHPDWSFRWAEYEEDSTSGSATLPAASDVGRWDIESFGHSRGTVTGTRLGIVDYKDWWSDWSLKGSQPPTDIVIKPDNTIVLTYPADAVYEISGIYWTKAVTMTADADVPLYAVDYHRAIIAKAKMYYFEDQEMTSLYQVAEKEFLEVIKLMEKEYLPSGRYLGVNESAIPAVRAV